MLSKLFNLKRISNNTILLLYIMLFINGVNLVFLMLKIKNSNTILYCNNWQETVTFYKTKLCLAASVEKDWFVEFQLTESSFLSIANSQNTSVKSSKGKGLTITFEVDDIVQSYQKLLGAGLNPSSVKDHSWGAKVVYIFDPEGIRLEVWSANKY